jgi:hypothetical protein
MPDTLFTDVRNTIGAIAAETQVWKNGVSNVKTNTDQVVAGLLEMQGNSGWSAVIAALDAWIDDPENSEDGGMAAALAMQAEIVKLKSDFLGVKRAIKFWQQIQGYNRAAFESEAGFTIVAVSPANEVGNGTLTAKSTGSLAYTPPGGSEGATVAIANGETKVLPGNDTSMYLVVTRDTATDLSGTYDVEILKVI